MSVSSTTIVEYIRATIQILMEQTQRSPFKDIQNDSNVGSPCTFGNSEADGLINSPKSPPKEYEELIQKLEGDVRTHIRIESQMRLQIEALEGVVEKLQKDMEQSTEKYELKL